MKKLLLALFVTISFGQLNAQIFSDSLKQEMRSQVVEACRHAWTGYKQFAWGFDDFQPLTRSGKNWYNHSLQMTPVDAFDTFILLGMKEEADEAKKLILSRLNFNTDNSV